MCYFFSFNHLTHILLFFHCKVSWDQWIISRNGIKLFPVSLSLTNVNAESFYYLIKKNSSVYIFVAMWKGMENIEREIRRGRRTVVSAKMMDFVVFLAFLVVSGKWFKIFVEIQFWGIYEKDFWVYKFDIKINEILIFFSNKFLWFNHEI